MSEHTRPLTKDETAKELVRVQALIADLKVKMVCTCPPNPKRAFPCICNSKARAKRMPLLQARLKELQKGNARWIK